MEDKKTGLVTLQIDWTNRTEAAEWANELVSRLNAEMRERAIKKANASMQFLERELQTTSTVEVREAISHLMEAQEKQRMLANVTQDYAFRVVDRAIASDMDEPVWPPRKLFFIAGPVLGLFLGVLSALSLDQRSYSGR